jgi:hypothetical protein
MSAFDTISSLGDAELISSTDGVTPDQLAAKSGAVLDLVLSLHHAISHISEPSQPEFDNSRFNNRLRTPSRIQVDEDVAQPVIDALAMYFKQENAYLRGLQDERARSVLQVIQDVSIVCWR